VRIRVRVSSITVGAKGKWEQATDREWVGEGGSGMKYSFYLLNVNLFISGVREWERLRIYAFN